jgi:hypothetical protein
LSLQSLYIARTEETPEVDFNTESRVFLIKGRSLPEDAFSFYKPLIEWLEDYFKQMSGEVEFQIALDYFNSSSGRYLMEMLCKLESQIRSNQLLKVTWIAEVDDEVMLEKGEEFKSLINLPFEMKIIPAR